MRKILHLTITILIMLVVSRFVVRLVDATVQINDDIGLLILLLVIVNAIIAGLVSMFLGDDLIFRLHRTC